MAMPDNVSNIEPGLAYLTQLDQVVVKQVLEMVESKLTHDMDLTTHPYKQKLPGPPISHTLIL